MAVEQLKLFEIEHEYRFHPKFREGIFKEKSCLIDELSAKGYKRIYRVLSFGGGTQSTHLLEQHLRGLIDYDYIIFADTGAEPEFIHEQVKWWQHRQRQMGNKTPFVITHHSSMERGLEEMLMRYILTDYQRFQMPVYCSQIDAETGEIKAAGLMPRQCTVDFKIVPVKQTARRLVMDKLGLGYRQRMPADIAFVIDIGFSSDEINRISVCQSPQFNYMYLAYPLVEEGVSTNDSIQFLMDNHFPTRRSRCYLCPFNCDKPGIGMDWKEIIREEPLSFLKACWFDERLRAVQRTGTKIMKSVPYLHFSRRPLKEVYEAYYDQLIRVYQPALNEWLVEWEKFIKKKYEREVSRDVILE